MIKVKHIVKTTLLAVVLISSISCAAESKNTSVIDKNAIQKSLEKFFGKIDKNNISTTDFDGVAEVLMTNPIDSIFVSSNGKYLIQGDIINLDKRAKMSSGDKVKLLKKAELDSIKDSDKIIFKAKNEKYSVNVFTDVDCPFCAKLHAEVGEINDLGITINYLASPLEQLHPKAQMQMEKIWCASDKVKAMDDYKRNRIIPNSPKCDNPVASQIAIARKLGVNGTPAIFLEDGTQISGYVPAKTLLTRIENSKKER